jgi:hypothetical protein
MSNSLAIAAVTATLKRILDGVALPLPFDPDPDSDLADCTCSARPPDKARQSEDTNQLNLFLYQTAINPVLRNMDAIGRTAPGETGSPPLALNLYYLLTAYGRNFDDILGHRVLGRAMSILHDRALLMGADIEAALPLADLGQQIERVRITPHTLGGEELSKLWAIFQAPYRITTAYQVSVVLIDSARPSRTPLPVLQRNLRVRPTIVPPFPTLEHVVLPRVAQPSARIGFPPGPIVGDTLLLTGHDLAGDQATVTFAHRLLPEPSAVVVPTPSDGEIAFDLPGDQDGWPAGAYTVSARVVAAAPVKDATSNGIALTIAPRLVGGVPGTYARDGSGVITVPVKLSPKVWPEQSLSLLVGDREVVAPPRTFRTADVTFTIPGLAAGTYPVRARVDGVDSHLLAYSVSAPPAGFDPTQSIVVT